MNITRIYSTAALAVALTVLTGCANKGKDAALWDCDNIAGMSKENQFLLLQGLGCGALFKQGSGGSAAAAGGSEEPATVVTENAGAFEIIFPEEEIAKGATPEGDFEGITFHGEEEPLSGFVGSIPGAGADSAADLAAAIIAAIGGMSEVNTVDIVSSQTIPDVTDTVVLQLGLATLNDHTATELSNLLLALVGTNVTDGSVSNLPLSESQEGSGDEFRVVIQITRGAGGESLIALGASLSSDYDELEAQLAGFLDGTNVTLGGASVIASSADFTATGPARADFLWVVDNSGSMSQEQSAVIANASNFFDRMDQTGLDFSIGVITTDSPNLRGVGFTADKTDFEAAVDAGISGSGTEAGIYYAEAALSEGGSVAAAGKATAKLTVVMLSDEGDHYACKTGGSKNNGNPACTGGSPFDQTDNVFLSLGVKVYSIIGLDGSSGKPGVCDGGVAKATSANNADPAYFDLAKNTGGSSASICNTDYSAVLENIANQAAAASSDYRLSETPISSSLSVTVDGVAVPRSLTDGFFYNSATGSIIFAGDAIPAAGATILVAYRRFQ